MIGKKIKLYRQSKGWSLDQLAVNVIENGGKISKVAISKIEREIINPSPTTIKHLSKALGVDPLLLIAPSDYQIKPLAFRKKSSLSKNDINRIKSSAETELEKNAWLYERVAPETFKIHKHERKKIDTPLEAENIANKVRSEWQLGHYPINNLTLILEENGIFVSPINERDNFDGYSIILENAEGKVLTALSTYNSNHPGERQRFSLAHELAHILFYNEDDELNEKLANRFASALLLPAKEIKKIVGERRSQLSFDELISYKKYFRASIQAILYRLKDLKIISNNYYSNWFRILSQAGLRKKEPEELKKEVPKKLSLLVKRAVSEGYITNEEAEKKFKIFVDQEPSAEISLVQKFMNLPDSEKKRIFSEQANASKDFYENNTSLEEFRENELDDD